ncbi:phosphate ABC transporter permease subunit PstC [Pandoraea thiooxydans]|uniref:Phosphate transport system permease protein n=1 Tax=Pandoraea thiooxydans TaxID=445709 RepID=A0A0G3EUC0_9BURK|nr:phosphate ABC transporter permease subunit PstC [Pandoraea thiooxydans]AKJ68316.1 phosphate ABC transporter permease subunit PstC [Pandoraea thiooxydans]
MRSFRLSLQVVTGIIPLLLLAIFVFLTAYSWPAIRFNGLGFLFSKTWSLGNLYADPIAQDGYQVAVGAHYGIWVFVVGTLASSAIALLLAVPIGMGVAFFLSEYSRGRVRAALSQLVELLAMVPSVVYGLWGLEVLAPLVLRHIAPALADLLHFIPFFSGTATSGYGLLTAGLVLALMVVPVISSTLVESMQRVPRELRESCFALGATRAEMIGKILLPAVRVPLIGSVILALGRALGETMAVLMVSGGALNYLPHTLYSPITSMAAFIASQLDSALQDPSGMAVRSLAEIALVLLVIAVIVNVIARLLTSQVRLADRA